MESNADHPIEEEISDEKEVESSDTIEGLKGQDASQVKESELEISQEPDEFREMLDKILTEGPLGSKLDE